MLHAPRGAAYGHQCAAQRTGAQHTIMRPAGRPAAAARQQLAAHACLPLAGWLACRDVCLRALTASGGGRGRHIQRNVVTSDASGSMPACGHVAMPGCSVPHATYNMQHSNMHHVARPPCARRSPRPSPCCNASSSGAPRPREATRVPPARVRHSALIQVLITDSVCLRLRALPRAPRRAAASGGEGSRPRRAGWPPTVYHHLPSESGRWAAALRPSPSLRARLCGAPAGRRELTSARRPGARHNCQ
jgi:hypothetical protein